jgi:hypothetical protein
MLYDPPYVSDYDYHYKGSQKGQPMDGPFLDPVGGPGGFLPEAKSRVTAAPPP